MPYVDGVNTDIFDPKDRETIIQWGIMNTGHYTMLLVWEEFTQTERRAIAKLMSEAGEHITMAKLPFVKLRDVWGALWRRETEIRTTVQQKGFKPVTQDYMTRIVQAVRAQKKLEEAKDAADNTGLQKRRRP